MDIDILKKAGLTDSQAKGYLALIEQGELSPAQLAQASGENRTNGYAIVDRLVQLGLAYKKEGVKQSRYLPAHPLALETLAEKRRKAMTRNEQLVKQGLSPLIDLFYAGTETPGTRTLQGIDGIKEVYDETLLTPDKSIYLLRTASDVPSLGNEYLDVYRDKRALVGIDTYALTPDTKKAREHAADGTDSALRFHRTFLPKDGYTAPVEIDVYGNKVALIAFGETQMATVITSPPIAEAMRQILKLLSNSFSQ